MLSKMHLRVQMDAKSGLLKNESKSEIFSSPGDTQQSPNGTTINVFDVHLMVQFRVHVIIHLEVHFKIYIKVHKKVHLRVHLMVHLRIQLVISIKMHIKRYVRLH